MKITKTMSPANKINSLLIVTYKHQRSRRQNGWHPYSYKYAILRVAGMKKENRKDHRKKSRQKDKTFRQPDLLNFFASSLFIAVLFHGYSFKLCAP